ncbi:hypothetical protein KC19_N026800 [Ceratodon purpureus]|nr:hypothetical protein KC19_N026800 [Ceratodon purpureus]
MSDSQSIFVYTINAPQITGRGMLAHDSLLICNLGYNAPLLSRQLKWISASFYSELGFSSFVWDGDPFDPFALPSDMAIAIAARPLVPSAACVPWRGASQVRGGAALVPVSGLCSRVEGLRAVEKRAFGRGFTGSLWKAKLFYGGSPGLSAKFRSCSNSCRVPDVRGAGEGSS